LISELCVARESEGGSVIVILAEKEKEEMEYAAPPAHQSYLSSTRRGTP
jgi:hypothetical protein